MKEVILTGIKPTGIPHIGNYFGAIKPAIDFVDDTVDNYYFIADYHALTTIKDPKLLKELTYKLAAVWLACGLDPNKVVFYKQSDVPETFELTTILTNVTPKGLMNRAHAYKAMVEKNNEAEADPDFGVNMGLYNYPILMAADIMLLNSKKVPVGKDQKQHVEIARDIANAFNKTFGKTLVVPDVIIKDEVAVIPGLDGEKMSKSYGNVIPLMADETTLNKLIKSMKTDSTLPNQPKDTKSLVFQYYKLFANKKQIEEMQQKFETGISWADAKTQLFEVANTYLKPIREKYNYYIEHTNEIDEILKKGAEQARKTAKETILRVRKAIGVE